MTKNLSLQQLKHLADHMEISTKDFPDITCQIVNSETQYFDSNLILSSEKIKFNININNDIGYIQPTLEYPSCNSCEELFNCSENTVNYKFKIPLFKFSFDEEYDDDKELIILFDYFSYLTNKNCSIENIKKVDLLVIKYLNENKEYNCPNLPERIKKLLLFA